MLTFSSIVTHRKMDLCRTLFPYSQFLSMWDLTLYTCGVAINISAYREDCGRNIPSDICWWVSYSYRCHLEIRWLTMKEVWVVWYLVFLNYEIIIEDDGTMTFPAMVVNRGNKMQWEEDTRQKVQSPWSKLLIQYSLKWAKDWDKVQVKQTEKTRMLEQWWYKDRV